MSFLGNLLFVFCYFIYRVINVLTNLYLIRVRGNDADVYSYRILWRCKWTYHDIARYQDFIVLPFFSRQISQDELMHDGRWSVYSIDRNYVYFVWMDEVFTDMNVRKYPFLSRTQSTKARYFTWISRRDFVELVNTRAADASSRIVICSNTARSGTTLMAAMMHSDSMNIVSLTEPGDAFTLLAYEDFMEESTRKDVGLIACAILNYTARSLPTDKTLLYKFRSRDTLVAQAIYSVNKRFKHIFMYRKDTAKVVQSMTKVFRSTFRPGTWILLHRVSPQVARWVVGYDRALPGMWDIANPRDAVELAMFHFAISVWAFESTCNEIPYDVLCYEDLMKDPRTTILALFKFVNGETPDEEALSNALAVLRSDSQKNDRALSRENLSSYKNFEMTPARCAKLQMIFDRLAIPDSLNEVDMSLGVSFH